MAFIVETHMHLLADDLRRYPLAPIGGQQSPWSVGASLTPEAFIAMMDAAGVAKATAVQASTSHGYDNNYTADSVARYPDRFVGVACIDPLLPDAPDTLSYWVEQRGMRGVRLFTTGGQLPESFWLDQPVTHPFWDGPRLCGSRSTSRSSAPASPWWSNSRTASATCP
jgi:predicted TIM-barrel fold metal-dependent hydrolase